jgi:hypothetical protein
MDLISTHRISELVALATYLEDEKFLSKLRDEGFRKHVTDQKRFISKFLLNGYELIETMDLGREPIRTAATLGTELPIQLAAPASASIPASATILPTEAPTAIQDTKVVQHESVSQIECFLQKIIVEKTGYPLEMVQPAVDLDEELGIDTVKKMEIFADLGQRYQLTMQRDLNLSQLTTITKMAEVVHQQLNAK